MMIHENSKHLEQIYEHYKVIFITHIVSKTTKEQPVEDSVSQRYFFPIPTQWSQ